MKFKLIFGVLVLLALTGLVSAYHGDSYYQKPDYYDRVYFDNDWHYGKYHDRVIYRDFRDYNSYDDYRYDDWYDYGWGDYKEYKRHRSYYAPVYNQLKYGEPKARYALKYGADSNLEYYWNWHYDRSFRDRDFRVCYKYKGCYSY